MTQIMMTQTTIRRGQATAPSERLMMNQSTSTQSVVVLK